MFAVRCKTLLRNSVTILQGKCLASPAIKLGSHQICKNVHDGPSHKEVVELRTYTIYPNKMKEFLTFTNENFHLRTKHSKLLAYWYTEIGGINEVVHMAGYDDLNHRAKVRTGLANNEEWNTNFIAKISHTLQKMENVLVKLHPDSPVPEFSKESGVFELELYQMTNNLNQWSEHLKNLIKDNKKLTKNLESSLVGVWQSFIGPQNACVMIWQHATPNDVIKLKSQMTKDATYLNFTNYASSHTTKMLNPFIKDLWCDPYEEKMSW